MHRIHEFAREWQRLHPASMDVSGDVSFFCQLHGRLHGLAGREARLCTGADILQLLLYTENIIAVGLDGVYEYMYRSLGDVVFHWCDGLGMDANATSQVHNLVSEAVAKAPGSSLRQWMTESVLSRDFRRLSEMLVWFASEDKILRRVFPDLRHRKAIFLRLTGDGQAALRMLWPDLAFNWRDKRGRSLSETIARQFRLSASSMGEQERGLLKEAAEILDTIRAERLDTYTAVEDGNGKTLALRHRDGRMFRDVTFLMPVAGSAQGQALAVQLVTYCDRTYVNGPVKRLSNEEADDWNGSVLWKTIEKKEKEDARHACFTTPFGKRISLYEDLYTLPEDPEEAYYAEQGIYLDEPDIFDFLEWLKPAPPRQQPV